MLILDARYVATATSVDGLPPPAFAEIAFAGRSNVGKSSLINCLVERSKLVRTSSKPGATRGISVFRVDLRAEDGVTKTTIDLVDLPGYGFAQRSKAERKSWGPMIEGFLEDRVGLRGVVLIVDARRGVEDDDRQLIEYLQHLGKPVILAATKLDKLTKAERAPALAAIAAAGAGKPYGVSSETREGREKLFARVLALAGVATSATT
jgi:GTP-binding protein